VREASPLSFLIAVSFVDPEIKSARVRQLRVWRQIEGCESPLPPLRACQVGLAGSRRRDSGSPADDQMAVDTRTFGIRSSDGATWM